MFSIPLHNPLRVVASLALLACFAASSYAQQPASPPLPVPEQDEQTLSVATEEVFVPLMARDDGERFDPTLEPDDILVLENGVAQKITSVRRLPASVLFVLDTTGVENQAMHTTTTAAAALALIARLRPDDRIAVIEQGTRVRLLQDWTTDRPTLARRLRTNLASGNAAQSARFTNAVRVAASLFDVEPRGNRHVVFITDGVERFDGKSENLDAPQFAQARAQLAATGALVHIISYTQLKPERSTLSDANKAPPPTITSPRASNGLPDTVTMSGDTTRPNGARGGSPDPRNSGSFSISFDPAMRRRRQAYRQALKASERRLASLTETSGGKLWLPVSADEMIEQSRRIAGEIAAQYTVTYKPQRPFTSGERRRLEVASRRVGLQLETRRRFVTGAPANVTP